MNKTSISRFILRHAICLAFIGFSLRAAPPSNEVSTDFPVLVPFELGDAQFAPGDSISITELRGATNAIAVNQTYAVSGTYVLHSCDAATLAFYSTVPHSGATPVDAKQTVRITAGTGTFRLIKTIHEDGYLHVSFYPVSSGGDFGGIYFGQGAWVLRERRPGAVEAHADHLAQSLCEYLGEPVAAPPDLNPAYTQTNLFAAVQSAAQTAGIMIKRLELDDSEFPFILGVLTREGEFDRLADQMRRMKPYEYGGSVGSQTVHAFNIIPWSGIL